jgi:hypothetical protein
VRPGKIPGNLSEPAEIAYTSFASRLAHFARIFTGIALPLLVLAGTLLHFEGAQGKGCVTCHEIWQPYSTGTIPLTATSLAPIVTEMFLLSTPDSTSTICAACLRMSPATLQGSRG